MMYLFSLFLLISSAGVSSGSNTSGTTMESFDYLAEVPSVSGNPIVSADELTDGEDRMMSRLKGVAVVLGDKVRSKAPEDIVERYLGKVLTRNSDLTGGESVETTLSRIKGASSTTPQTDIQELKINAVKVLIQDSHMVKRFMNTFGEKKYEDSLFHGLCTIFGDDAMPKALYHLKQDDSVHQKDMIAKLWKLQFKSWKANDVSTLKAFGYLPTFNRMEEISNFYAKALVLDEYIKYGNRGQSNDIVLFNTLIQHYQGAFGMLMNECKESIRFRYRFNSSLNAAKVTAARLFKILHKQAGGVVLFEGYNYKLLTEYVRGAFENNFDTNMVVALRNLSDNDADFALLLAKVSLTSDENRKKQATYCLYLLFREWERDAMTYVFDRSTSLGKIVDNCHQKYKAGLWIQQKNSPLW